MSKIVESAAINVFGRFKDQLLITFLAPKESSGKGVRAVVFAVAAELEDLRQAAGLRTVVCVNDQSDLIEVDADARGVDWIPLIVAACQKCNVPCEPVASELFARRAGR